MNSHHLWRRWPLALLGVPVLALVACGADRQRLLQKAADIHKEEVVHVPFFEMAVFYAVDPKLTFAPRFDRRIRANSLWFAP